MSKLAGCGHTVDLWCANQHTVCKACFEKRGFVYNLNSFRDLDLARPRAGVGLAAHQKPKRKKTPADRPHGFEWTYAKGCRCAECCAAATAAHLERRQAKAAA